MPHAGIEGTASADHGLRMLAADVYVYCEPEPLLALGLALLFAAVCAALVLAAVLVVALFAVAVWPWMRLSAA